MGFWFALAVNIGISAVSYLLSDRNRNRAPIQSQRRVNTITSRGDVDYPLLWVLGERRIRARVFYQDVEQYTITEGIHFSPSRPGRGLRLQVGATICQDETDEATWLSVDDDRYLETLIPGENLQWTRGEDTADGGKVFTASTSMRGVWTMVFYHAADGSQLSTLHEVAARIFA